MGTYDWTEYTRFPEHEEEVEDQFLPYTKVEHETEKAILFSYEDKKFWVPKSVIQNNYTKDSIVQVIDSINIKIW